MSLAACRFTVGFADVTCTRLERKAALPRQAALHGKHARLQDGRISEAVVWDVPAGERHLVPDQLLAFALRRHLPVGAQVQGFAACLDGALTTPSCDLTDATSASRSHPPPPPRPLG